MSITIAQAHLAELQAQRPLLVGQDRINRMFSAIVPALPPAIKTLWDSGHLAVGEVNIPQRLVQSDRVPEDGDDYVITMSSAFMQYIYAVARTLSGNISVTDQQNKKIPNVLTVDQVVEQLKGIFEIWMTRAPWSDKPYSYPQFQLPKRQLEIAETMTRGAELFMLAHEVLHVLVQCSPGNPIELPGLDESQSEEMLADAFATISLFDFGRDGDLRYLYASLLFAVRILTWLERLGFRCGATHPPAELRLAHVRTVSRSMFADDESFAYISNIAEAFNDQLEDIENKILNQATVISQSPDRVLTRLMAVLEEYIRGRLSVDECCKTATHMIADVPAETLPTVVTRICEFFDSPMARRGPDFRQKMLNAFNTVIAQLPDELKGSFEPVVNQT